MEGGRSPAPAATNPKPKFVVYQNPSFSAALTATSLRPSAAVLLLNTFFSLASALLLLATTSRHSEKLLLDSLARIHASPSTALLLVKGLQSVLGLMLVATMTALIRALSLRTVRIPAPSKKPKEQQQQGLLSQRQLGLLGLKPKPAEQVDTQPPKKPLKPTPLPSDALVPIRKWASSYTPTRPARSADQQSMGSGQRMTMSPMLTPLPSHSPAQYGVSPATPWSRKSSGSGKGIQTEAMLEQFLEDVDERITDLEAKAGVVTPSPTLHGFGVATPGSVASMTTASGTTRSTPLRPVRMSPGSYQKYSTPPKKGERELPPPMSMEQAIEAFESLGIYPQIEQWRDHMRQWFSSFLIHPLLQKIETSDIQLMQAAANAGVSINVSQVGSNSIIDTPPVNVSPIDGPIDWQPAVTLDEDELLHQLRASLAQIRDRSISHVPLFNQQQPQQTPQLPIIQACLDAIAEHQRLKTLMKGELIKGLLPQSSVRADYTVQRVEELAEGTCLKNYDYLGHVNGYGKGDEKWMSELPSDSHLLLYLFCAFLEHPKWMLHVDPTSYSGSQSSKNPLFLGVLPPKERFPEKYLAVISGVPSVIHPGACILSVGKQNPPIFALYWDKKLQFSIQGMTALWDAVLLFCHQIMIGYGGVVHGLHLGSSAFNILPVLEMDTESWITS